MIRDVKLASLLREMRDPEHRFTFSCWDAHHWSAVLGQPDFVSTPADHAADSALCYDLAGVLHSKPEYTLGVTQDAVRLAGDHIREFLHESDLSDLKWVSGDVFSSAKGSDQDLILSALRSRKILLVGPEYVSKISRLGVEPWGRVITAPKNCFQNLRSVFRKVMAAVESQTDSILIVISASLASGLLCDWLHTRLGSEHSVVDLGGFLHSVLRN